MKVRHVVIRRFLAALIVVCAFLPAAFGTPAMSYAKWTFVSISDSQMGVAVFKQVLQAIKNDPNRPEFVIHCGDHIATAGDRAEWNTFFKLFSVLGDMPLYSTPGNHDVNGPQSQKVFIEMTNPPGGSTYYSFEHKNAFVIALDAMMPGAFRRIGPEQREWLIRTLESRKPWRDRWTFVFFHTPIFPQGMYKKVNQPMIGGEQIHEIFSRYKVTAVFSGHEHMYNHYLRGGVHYFINGGAGGSLYRGYGGDFHHYLRVTVSDDDVVVRAIDVKGRIGDEKRIPAAD